MVRQLVGRRRLERCLTWVNMNEFMVALVIYIPRFVITKLFWTINSMRTFYLCINVSKDIHIIWSQTSTPRRERSSEPICANLHGVFPCHFIEIITKNTQYLWIDFSNRFFFFGLPIWKCLASKFFSQVFVGVFRIGNFMESSHGIRESH